MEQLPRKEEKPYEKGALRSSDLLCGTLRFCRLRS